MIIYNLTAKIDWSIHEQWLTWILEIHVPEVLATGLFHDSRIMRLLEVDDQEGPTYAIQFYTGTIENYHDYIATYAPLLRAKSIQEWGDKFIAFRSLMETVN
jgi:hypothetical protein